MFGPPARHCRILISRRIFFFFTGFSTLITHAAPLASATPSKTSLYLPRPSRRTTWYPLWLPHSGRKLS